MEWKVVKCQDVIDIRDGTHDTPKYVNVGYPLITSKNLKNGSIDFSEVSYISAEDYIEINKRSKVDKGDILLAMIGTIGNPVIVDVDQEFSIKNVALFKLQNSPVDPRFFKYLLESSIVKKQLERETKGGTQKFVSLKVLRNLEIPLPPIASQRRIANILDKADEIIRKRKDAIALTEQLQKSIFLDMFGDPVINPKGWEVVELGKLIIGKPNNGIFRKNDEYGGKIPVIWVKELFRDSILNTKNSISLDPTEQEIKKFGLKKGDILFCRSSLKLEGIGYNNVFDDEDDSALFECHLIRVSPNQSKINSIFLNYLLRTEGMRKVIISKSNTVTMSTIGQEQIKTIPVILPPKNIQDNFDKQLRYLIKLIAKKQFFLQESENLFNSLLQKAFKGEL
ncbi:MULTISPECIES: restriction endonuclease subunit S [Planktothrix]|uniref:Restriction modification system DNA specificity domain n=1 Tax=Planktothrix agardhii No758 TaxID=1964479 RepID=A0A1U9WXT4_PLAAG|nr:MULTISPECIES: restriction endonuclease subunit S [Planktothrix]AQY60981.1 Restriction modification system DNA specificity domain [Planktothrix agardhii No758]CAD5972239.1 putative protein MJ1218 [Planktothrix agardhii]